MLTLAWRYLTGRAVATDVTGRGLAEWPPHPDRVFQALVEAWGERGRDADEEAALKWLQGLPPPDLSVPDPDEVWGGAAPIVYVPTNDAAGGTRRYGDNQLAILPAHRTRKPRTFPATVVGDAVCALTWSASPPAAVAPALSRLAGEVTRIGHTHSLVRMWIEPTPPPATWVPAELRATPELQLRVAHPGRLEALVAAYGESGEGWRRPPLAAWRGYCRAARSSRLRGDNAGRLVVLRRVAGIRPGLHQVVALARQLRSRLAEAAHGDPEIRALVSGHAPGGGRLDRPHVGYLPLPFVDAPHADGHLLGLALLLPRDLAYEDEDGVLSALLATLDPEADTLTLATGDGRTISLGLEERPAPPHFLRVGTWARSARRFATVTPIVLDKMPPRRHPDPDRFVIEQLEAACRNIGLPRPNEVVVGDVGFITGVPPSRRFAGLRTKQGLGRRHVHAVLRFDDPVSGPLVLGAGRYLGMGLLCPIRDVTMGASSHATGTPSEAP